MDIFVHDRQLRQTTRVSVASGGTEANGESNFPCISAEGQFIAFQSRATNLVPGDTNLCSDIFVCERQTGAITRVSVAGDGTQASGSSWFPSISADGRYVAFVSEASNLVPGIYPSAIMPNGDESDIYVHDRLNGTTTRVSVSSAGAKGNAPSERPRISADGRYVAFESFASNLVPGDTNATMDIFVHDRQTGETTRVSVATDGTQSDGPSLEASISADGRYVAFRSTGANLVPGDTNVASDIFVRDRLLGQTTRVSLSSSETQGSADSYAPSISSDGRYVAFASIAADLVPGDVGYTDIFVRDRQAGATTRVSVASGGTAANGDSYNPSISADGRCTAFSSWAYNLDPGDTNGFSDVFLNDRGPHNLSLSPNSGSFLIGSKVTFTSRYADPDGYGNLANCYLLINNILNQANAAFLSYDANANKLYVRNDANTAWLGGHAPGSAYVIENSYVRLYCEETTKSVSGITLTVNWKISFKLAMSPKTCGAWMLVYDDNGFKDSFEQKGAGIKISRAPSNVSLAPTTGSFATGTKVTFTSSYSDPDGHGNLANCYLLINSTSDQANAAFLRYDPNADKLYVKNDSNVYWMGGVAPGSAPVIENSYVRLYCAETTRSGSGSTLTVNWKVSFKPAMSGKTCGAWMLVYDDINLRDGWDQMGSGIKISQTPLNASLSPTGGSLAVGRWFTLTSTYSDPDGAGNLANCYLLMNTSLNPVNGVFVRYDANTNKLYLKNDANTAWVGGYAPGAAPAIHNTQCALSCSGTTVTPSGNSLIIGWRLYLKAPMAHKALPAWMLVYDDIGLRDGYDHMGTYTVP
jgi:Tol biopolymer transport system component